VQRQQNCVVLLHAFEMGSDTTNTAAGTQPITSSTPLPNDKYALYLGKGVAMVLTDTYNLDDLKQREEETFLVYADTINVPAEANFQQANGTGRNVGLFCNRMVLQGLSAKISVSGKNAVDATANTTTPNVAGSAGWLRVCVEEMTGVIFLRVSAEGTRSGLFLEALGGVGGIGPDTTHVTNGKSDGGNGGKLSDAIPGHF